MQLLSALNEVPEILKTFPNWVLWKRELGENGPTKVPYQVGKQFRAANNNPSHWTDFDTAARHVDRLDETGGLGFVIAGKAVEAGIIGIDLDGCRNPRTGKLTDWAEAFLDCLDSYSEVTPSRTGIRIWVRGTFPSDKHVFKLDPKSGYGDKVQIEVYSQGRYFTVTGESLYAEPCPIEKCDLAAAYKLCEEIAAKHPADKASRDSSPSAVKPSVQVQCALGSVTDKLHLLMAGTVTSEKPFVVSDERGNSIEYPSHSEADMALCSLLALRYQDAAKINEEFHKSPLYREKWDRLSETTIEKALKSVRPLETVLVESALAQQQADDTETAIPPFDPSVINGIYAKFVELVTRGTTLAPQFAFVIAKTIVGLRMAGKVKFENLDVEPRYYTALIGETGSGKGESWRRTEKILNPDGAISSSCGIKVIHSADSGAGITDLFFDPPESQPVLCYVDEIESLGNKAKDTRNPAILDKMIELADSTSLSRVLAKRQGGGSKSKHDARFGMVMCGQDGLTYTKALAGRTKLGLWDRFYPEYGVRQETGDLPPVNPIDAHKLLAELNSLNYSSTMGMDVTAKTWLDDFWNNQPPEVRKKARWKKNLLLDAYMSAFGRGARTVETEDAAIAIKIFRRQLVIRQRCFSVEVPDRTGYYIGLIKNITAKMEQRLKAGIAPELVAKSRRDFEKETNAYRDNEIHIFERAWNVYEHGYLKRVKIQKANGQTYDKYLPRDEE